MKNKSAGRWILAWFIITFIIALLPTIGLSGKSWISTFLWGFGLLGFVIGLFMLILWRQTKRKYSKRFELRSGEPKRLEVQWTYGFRTVKVFLDGKEIGSFNSPKEFKKGVTIQLPEGRILEMKVGVEGITPVPDISLDGEPLPDSVSNPELEIKKSSRAFFMGAVVNIFSGILYFQSNLWWYSVFVQFVIGGILAISAGLLIRDRSRSGLNLGIFVASVYALSYLYGICLSTQMIGLDSSLDILGNIIDFFETGLFIYGLYKGFRVKRYFIRN